MMTHVGNCRMTSQHFLLGVKKWKMEFNVDKCHITEFGKSGRRPHWEYKLGANCLQNS